MEKKIKSLQIVYCLIILVAAAIVFFSESGNLPMDYIGDEPHKLYWLNMYAIVVAFGGMFLCLRMFVFKYVKKTLTVEDEGVAFAAYYRWTLVRLFIIAMALWSNIILYFSTSYTSTPQYCVLVTLVSCVFCWPSFATFKGIRQTD